MLYADAGYQISPLGHGRFRDHLEMVSEYNMPAFNIRGSFSKWTKGDALHYFGVSGRSEILSSRQIQSGLIFCRHTTSNLLLMSHCAECCVTRDYPLVDDSPSFQQNPPDFRENRHDQALLTLLIRMNQAVYTALDEQYHPGTFNRGVVPSRRSIPILPKPNWNPENSGPLQLLAPHGALIPPDHKGPHLLHDPVGRSAAPHGLYSGRQLPARRFLHIPSPTALRETKPGGGRAYWNGLENSGNTSRWLHPSELRPECSLPPIPLRTV